MLKIFLLTLITGSVFAECRPETIAIGDNFNRYSLNILREEIDKLKNPNKEYQIKESIISHNHPKLGKSYSAKLEISRCKKL